MKDLKALREPVTPTAVFSIHESPNPDCTVGRNIQSTIEPLFFNAQTAMEKVLENVTIEDVVKDISEKRESICYSETI